MKSHLIVTVTASITLLSFATGSSAAITFLNHFDNPSSFDIDTGNGDFSTGDTTATLSGTPTHAAGKFPASSLNNAFHANADGQGLAFDAFSGAVQPDSPTAGGITVGAWVKFSGSVPSGTIFLIGNPAKADDYVYVDYGNYFNYTPRVAFREGTDIVTIGGGDPSRTAPAVDMSDWVYFAATVDLTNQKLGFFGYDSSGVSLFSTVTDVVIGAGGWNVALPGNLDSRILIGGQQIAGSEMFIDEFSIDNRALTAGEISARVADMVAGNPLVVPEPSMALLGMGAAGLMMRRGRKTSL
jgi:hypothetical protein